MDVELPGWLRTAGWGVTGLVGGLWLLLLGLFVVGLLLGGPAPTDAPAVDLEEPPSEVAADAAAQLETQDFTAEYWFWHQGPNRTAPTGGILFRLTTEHSRSEVQLTQWRGALVRDQPTVVRPDDPHMETYATRGASYQQPAGRDFWVRSEKGGNIGLANLSPLDPDAVRNRSPTVLRDNASTLVLSFDDAAVLEGNGSTRGNSTVRVVITKGDDPHITSVKHRVENDDGVTVWHTRVTEWGTAEATRPPEAPSTTVMELLARSVHGLGRLF